MKLAVILGLTLAAGFAQARTFVCSVKSDGKSLHRQEIEFKNLKRGETEVQTFDTQLANGKKVQVVVTVSGIVEDVDSMIVQQRVTSVVVGAEGIRAPEVACTQYDGSN